MTKPDTIVCKKQTGSTLLELLSSMAILTVILGILAATLEAALGQFRSTIDQSQSATNANDAAKWIQKDLRFADNAISARSLSLRPGASEFRQRFFDGKAIFPFEINRAAGKGSSSSIPPNLTNASFHTLAFPTRNSDQGQRNDSSEALPALAAYYVSYTPDSPLPGNQRFSMKLFRHFRPSGNDGDGYSNSFLHFCHREINDSFFDKIQRSTNALDTQNQAAIRQGKFNNSDLPFLLVSRLVQKSGSQLEVLAATPGWPEFTTPPSDFAGRWGDADQWKDQDSAVHDLVYPDEAVAGNVVRFEVNPYRITENENGLPEVMDAARINRLLGLSNGAEWPCLVIPSFVEVTIGILDDQIAARLSGPEDWIVDWTNDEAASNDSAELIKANTLTTHFRVNLEDH